jgi:hypothetical protein
MGRYRLIHSNCRTISPHVVLCSRFVSPLLLSEEATALIGAHSIGMTRHTFGSTLAGPVSKQYMLYLILNKSSSSFIISQLHDPRYACASSHFVIICSSYIISQWVPSGADNATPCELHRCGIFAHDCRLPLSHTSIFIVVFLLCSVGPKFGNAFHNFLEYSIVEDDAISFSTNIAIFNNPFGTWMRVDPGPPAGFPMGLNFLDTDIALAFPSLDLTRHPDFDGYTTTFADDESTFLGTFFKALEKMGQLGVTVTLKHATICIPCGDSFKGELHNIPRRLYIPFHLFTFFTTHIVNNPNL